VIRKEKDEEFKLSYLLLKRDKHISMIHKYKMDLKAVRSEIQSMKDLNIHADETKKEIHYRYLKLEFRSVCLERIVSGYRFKQLLDLELEIRILQKRITEIRFWPLEIP